MCKKKRNLFDKRKEKTLFLLNLMLISTEIEDAKGLNKNRNN